MKPWQLLILFIACVSQILSQQVGPSRRAVEELLFYCENFESGGLQTLLLTAHPNDVTLEDIGRRVLWEERFIVQRHLIEGIVFPLAVDVHEDGSETMRLTAGADSALYTGFYLSGLVFRYLATGDFATLEKIAQTTDGIYKLTHITGVPGMLARYACPLPIAERDGLIVGPDLDKKRWFHIYYCDPANVGSQYTHLRNLVAGENVEKIASSPVRRVLDPKCPYYGDTYYYTRTTRDQMTGVIFGLAVVVYFFEHPNLIQYLPYYHTHEDHVRLIDAIRETAHQTSCDIFRYLHTHDWELKDHLTRKTGTSANDVSELLQLAVQMLFRRTLMNTFSPECNAWKENFRLLQSYDERLLPPGIGDPAEFTDIFSSAAWWGVTWNYYAWNLRVARIFAIVLLDDVHGDFYSKAPPEWPRASLEREEVNARNRRWMRFWNQKIWSYLYADSNPWFTCLYNYMRKMVLERHCDEAILKTALDRTIYSLSDGEFSRLFAEHDAQQERKLKEALFPKNSPPHYDWVSGKRTLGLGLAAAHFHIRSLAITPIRTCSSPCLCIKESRWDRCRARTPLPFYPPHLLRPHKYWMFARDLKEDPDSEKSDPRGSIERTMISLPTVFWLAYVSGQLDYQFDAFRDEWFVPPELTE